MSDDMSSFSPSSAGEQGVLRSMQEVAMSSQEASKMLRTYNIAWWGNNYYDVNELGHISVCPDPDVPEARVDLAKLVKAREAQGQRLPALFCFPQILQHRLRSINAAFKRARESYGYNGDYFLVYPIKVNQHRRVIESLIHSGEPLGLEAGSKAELMAVLAHAGMTRSVIVCNGYKDREYIRLALIGEKMGHKVYLVIEKMSEINIVLEEAERLNVVPRLGVRARLASQGSGKWQSSGGEKSKFGLAANQVLQLVEIMRERGRLDSIQLLHFHLGSQMANIRDIATGVRESARFYVELHKLGVNIQCFDVGGGLGVDYEGTRSKSDCSVNYGLNEYANNIIWAIGDACEENGLPHPTVITSPVVRLPRTTRYWCLTSLALSATNTPKRPRRKTMHRARCKACGKPGLRCTSRVPAVPCVSGCTTARWTCTIFTLVIHPVHTACRSVPGPSSCI